MTTTASTAVTPLARAAGHAAPDQTQPVHHFNLATPFKLVASGVLLGGIAYALQPFMGWMAAVPVAGVFTFSFGKLAEIAMDRRHARAVRIGATAFAFAIGTLSVSTSYSTLYAKTSAQESARREYEVKAERTERDVQRILTWATSAQEAMEALAKDAAEKSNRESTVGGTCPSRESGGKGGPITNWRRDEAGIMGGMGGELKAKVDTARAAAQSLAKRPAPDSYANIKSGYALLNTAIDSVAPLTKGGWPEGALSTLADRRSSQIDHPAGKFFCNDSGRLSLIDRASTELAKLEHTPALARLTPTIDLDKPMDVVTRGLVRGANLSAHAVTFGHAGSFADDPLLSEQVAKVGWINRETVPFGLSLIGEAMVLLTSFIAAQSGKPPFRMSLPAALRRREAAGLHRGKVRGALHGLGKLAANLFWSEAPAVSSHAQPAAAVNAAQPAPAWRPGRGSQRPGAAESQAFTDIDLPADPTVRQREQEWARPLAAWHHGWGMADFLVLPIDDAHRAELAMARSLAAHGLLTCHADGADHAVLVGQRPELDALLSQQLGDRRGEVAYQVWEVSDPGYGQILRLAALDQQSATTAATLPAATPVQTVQPVVAPTRNAMPRHVPFRQRLWQQRPWMSPAKA